MLLSDGDMRMALEFGIGLVPYDRQMVQPASLDMRLGPDFRVMTPPANAGSGAIDTRAVVDFTYPVPCALDEPFQLNPGMFVLAQTLETITLPANIAAKLEGKSSLGRLGLMLHATAGFIDPGFSGTITLELSLASPRPLIIYPGMKIGQLAFYQLSSPADTPYGAASLGSRYQGQNKPTASKYTG